ncbi:MAG: SxtJ family membrane protein [Deltaproteobacteria bacterium]|nr:SxtJ family membrane protein [Deltaproteobacteria bacterium]
MLNTIPKADKKELRKFGFVMGGVIGPLFGVLMPLILGRNYPLWPWVFSGLFLVWGVVWPAGMGPVRRVWMAIGMVLGAINSRIILTILFFGVFTPIGMLKMFITRDAMARGLLPGSHSYRVDTIHSPSNHMERPF